MTAPNTNQNENNLSDTPINEEPQVPAWQVAVFEAHQARMRAETEANELRNRINQAPPREPDPIPEGEVFNNPAQFLSRIRNEIKESTAPLNSFIVEFQRKENYQRLKNHIRSTLGADQLATFQRAEPYIDSHFLNNPQLVPDIPTFQTVLQNVIGQMAMNGTLFPVQPNNNNNSNRNNSNMNQNPPTIPPNVRPSGPPANNSPLVQVELTENERRLARESNLSPEEYVIMRDTDPNQSGTAWKKILADRKARANGGQ
jgi:hypothetical protein